MKQIKRDRFVTLHMYDDYFTKGHVVIGLNNEKFLVLDVVKKDGMILTTLYTGDFSSRFKIYWMKIMYFFYKLFKK